MKGSFAITVKKYGLITLLNPVCTASSRVVTPVGESVETGTMSVVNTGTISEYRAITVQKYGLITLLNPVCTASN